MTISNFHEQQRDRERLEHDFKTREQLAKTREEERARAEMNLRRDKQALVDKIGRAVKHIEQAGKMTNSEEVTVIGEYFLPLNRTMMKMMTKKQVQRIINNIPRL